MNSFFHRTRVLSGNDGPDKDIKTGNKADPRKPDACHFAIYG